MTRDAVEPLRQRLLDHGFQPISVFTRSKRPSEPGWQKTVGMPAYDATAENTGVLCGALFPLDIDVEDASIVDEITAMAARLFGRTIMRCRQNSPRRLLPYRIENPDARKIIIPLSAGKLEWLTHGQMFVGYGAHPTNVAFEWLPSPLDEVEFDELPLIDDAKIQAFAAWAQTRWPSPEKAKPNGDGRKRGKADFRNTVIKEDVEAALRQLPCDYDHDTWVKLGMSYRVGGGSEDVFLEWSRQHPDYRFDAYVRGQWKSFERTRSVTVATLFAEVFDRFPAWRKPSESEPERRNNSGAAHDEDDDWEGEEGAQDDGFIDCFELRRTEFPPLEFAAAPYVLAGQLTLLSANPKMGKSFMSLQIAIAIATGTAAFEGQPASKQGVVLYLALEDNKPRMKERVNKLLKFRRLEPRKLITKLEFKRAHEGGFEALRRWVKRNPEARLIIIDVLSLFRRPRSHREEPYAADLEAMTELRKLANELNVAILAIMHNRKSQADGDPFESISGTQGQTAGADTILVMHRERRGGITMHVTGRDITTADSAIKMNNGYWEILGSAEEVRHTDEQRAIIELLRENGKPMSPKEIAAVLGRRINVLTVQLSRMAQTEPPMILKIRHGWYAARKPV
jgi:hypothetical protein